MSPKILLIRPSNQKWYLLTPVAVVVTENESANRPANHPTLNYVFVFIPSVQFKKAFIVDSNCYETIVTRSNVYSEQHTRAAQNIFCK